MKISPLNKNVNSIWEFHLSFSSEEWKKFKTEASQQLANQFEIPGFRKGKAPADLISKKINSDFIKNRAMALAIKKGYLTAIRDYNLKPVKEPEIEILSNPEDSNQEFVFKLKIEVMPEFSLPDYHEIAKKIKRRTIKVIEKEIEEALLWLQKARAKISQAAKEAEINDFVEIEFSLGDEFKESHKDAFLLGQGHLIAGFEEQLVGMKAGDIKEFDLEFPNDFAKKELAGKKKHFWVKMISVKKVELPILDDEFAKRVGSFKNLQELKKSIAEGLLAEKEIAEKSRVRQELLDLLLDKSGLLVPETLIRKEKERLLAESKFRIEKELGLSFNDYLASIKKTEQDLKESFQEEARKRVGYQILLERISIEEKIEAEPDLIEEKIKEFLKNYKDPKQAQKEIDLQELKIYIKNKVIQEKTLSFLENLIPN